MPPILKIAPNLNHPVMLILKSLKHIIFETRCKYNIKKKAVALMLSFARVQQDFMTGPLDYLIFTPSPPEAVRLNRDDVSGLLNITRECVPETHSGC